MLVRSLLVTSLLLPATALADAVETTSYRKYTVTTDAIGLALFIGGDSAERENEALMTTGALTMLFGTPVIHAARGHTDRALGSWLMRSALGGTGMVIAMAANSDCDDGVDTGESFLGDDFLCQLDYIGDGMLGGLAVAMAIDAAFLTDEEVEPATWAPQLAAGRDGVRAGVAFSW